MITRICTLILLVSLLILAVEILGLIYLWGYHDDLRPIALVFATVFLHIDYWTLMFFTKETK